MLKMTKEQSADQGAASIFKQPPPLLLSQPSPVAKLVLAEVHDE
ncbi:hypothetical protein [Litoribacillus peritrichatus]